MSVLDLFSAARDLGRMQQIARVLLRHGMGDVVQRLHLAGAIQIAGEKLHIDPDRVVRTMDPEKRFRLALEELGTTFVKLGQLLSTRGDLLPDAWRSELAKLTEQVAAVPFDELRPQLEEDLGAPVEEVFATVDSEPLGGGSIAQVHAATLTDGTEVVLKIRRPGVRPRVEADLRLAARLAEVAAAEFPDVARLQPTRLVRYFGRILRDELDFAIEARNTELLFKQMQGVRGIVLPQVYAGYGSERLLVLERLRGVSAARWVEQGSPDVFDGARVERKQLAIIGVHALLAMIFEHGVYHADPHPGNVFFLTEPAQDEPANSSRPLERIGLIDCGMVGRLSASRRSEFLGMLGAADRGDTRRVADLLMRWSSQPDDLDEDALERDVHTFLTRYFGATMKEIDMRAVLAEILVLARDNGLVLPPDVASLIRVLSLLDSLATSLDPEFVAIDHIGKYVKRDAFSLGSLLSSAGDAGQDLGALLLDLPGDVRQLLRRARRGSVRLDLDLERLEGLGLKLENSVNRLVVGIVVAALIVGTAIVGSRSGGEAIFGLPPLAVLGFVSSCALGLVLVISILRSGRGR